MIYHENIIELKNDSDIMVNDFSNYLTERADKYYRIIEKKFCTK